MQEFKEITESPELIDIFIEDVEEHLDLLEQATDQKRQRECLETIIGSAKITGATSFSDKAVKWLNKLDAKDGFKRSACIKELRDELATLVGVLNSIVAKEAKATAWMQYLIPFAFIVIALLVIVF